VPDPKADRGAVERARAQAATNLRNTKRLYDAGVRIGLGTDTGGVSGGEFFGLGSHVELELLVTKVGLTPMQALVAGTRTSAENLGLSDLGTVAAGKSADFIVLDANPLDSIGNTRKISKVYIRGKVLDRKAMRASWTSQ
jgi:imidazolonepropionase-like amidohydrolase